MYTAMKDDLAAALQQMRTDGLYKEEGVLDSAQGASIDVGNTEVLNLCANNYLGLANDPRLVEAAAEGLHRWGFGLASVRFICGTQQVHKDLEQRLSDFLGADDTILYSSCFDANGGLFETLLGPDDAVISDELNHASIIDGIRLCKAQRYRYRNRDMADLSRCLDEAEGARYRLIATDGVFSMDGYLAPLDEIVGLAERHDALVMVDDSHAVGFVGASGAGTPELFGVQDQVDIVTGTLGKALGGASGGYTAARAEIVETLRQRSRPYLFSNSVTPSIAAASLAALDLVAGSADLRERLRDNTAWFRETIVAEGFTVPESDHPIVPVMIGDAVEASKMAEVLLSKGIYVRAFSYPVVPQGKARIRTQMSAAHTRADLERAVEAFVAARREVAG